MSATRSRSSSPTPSSRRAMRPKRSAIDWQPQPSVTGVNAAVKQGAPLVWQDHPGNVLFDKALGDKAKVDAIFAKAHAIAEVNIVNQRLITNYMETRGVVVEYDAKRDHITVTLGSQGSHRQRDVLCQILKLPPEKVRVITPDVGGGFGTKIFPYREYFLAAFAARKLKKNVKWVADRADHFLGDAHGRDNVTHARMALDADGKFLAMDVDMLADMGAYLSMFGPYIPYGGAGMLPGVYDIPAFHCRVRAIFTNSVPVDAYRGAGRPEAAYVIERLVDACARKLDMTPDAVRKKNFIPPKAMPYTTATGKVYDSGEFAAHLKIAQDNIDWKGFAKRAKEAKKKGFVRGIGMASYVEICGVVGPETADRQARRGRQHHRPDRLAIDRAGTPDGLCAAGRRAVRRRAGARQRHPGRHRPDRDRRRHRRLEFDPDRRRVG